MASGSYDLSHYVTTARPTAYVQPSPLDGDVQNTLLIIN